MDGIWGDDVEIQALSEIYNRPIEIYLYSVKPMRTFHEVSYNRNDPIKLSYHGKSHYNSVCSINCSHCLIFLKIKKKGFEEKGLTEEKFGVFFFNLFDKKIK